MHSSVSSQVSNALSIEAQLSAAAVLRAAGHLFGPVDDRLVQRCVSHFLFLDLNFTFASLIRISQLTESGIYRHWIGEIFVLNDKSTRTTRIGSDFEALQTKHFHGLSALFGIGMFFAAISACIEFVKNKSN